MRASAEEAEATVVVRVFTGPRVMVVAVLHYIGSKQCCGVSRSRCQKKPINLIWL